MDEGSNRQTWQCSYEDLWCQLQLLAVLDCTAVLSLVFDEPMDLLSLNVSGLQIMEFAYSGYGGHYRLTNHSGLWAEDYGREVGTIKAAGDT